MNALNAEFSIDDTSRRLEKPPIQPDDIRDSRSFDSEPFQNWASELHEFVTQTRLRLKSLSQSVAECQRARQVISPEPIEVAIPAETLVDSLSETKPIAAIPEEGHKPSHDQRSVSADEDRPADADPMQRLNAIKLRLAQQIENA